MPLIECHVDGMIETIRFLENVPKGCAQAERYAMYDLRRRIPPVVTRCVTNVYNIPAKEVKPGKSRNGGTFDFRATGNSIATLRFVYTGRLLTPVHFGMTPKSASMNPKRRYTLRMKVFKSGGREVFGQHFGNPSKGKNPYYPKSGNILFPTGAKSKEKTSHIPMQRVSLSRTDIEKFAVISIPQMISGEHCRDDIQERIGKLSTDRMGHSLSRVMGL